MGKSRKPKISWLTNPDDGNYPAARSYLSLIYDTKTVDALIEKLSNAQTEVFKAKDIFRASRLSLLGVSNLHVKKNKKKIRNGEALSPILLVRKITHGKVEVADGYHRLCTVYHYDEEAEIPCRIVTCTMDDEELNNRDSLFEDDDALARAARVARAATGNHPG